MVKDRRIAGWAVLAALVAVAVLAVAGVQVLVSSGLSRSLVVRVGAAAVLTGVALIVVVHPGIRHLVARAARDDSGR